MDKITYPCWNLSQSTLVKGAWDEIALRRGVVSITCVSHLVEESKRMLRVVGVDKDIVTPIWTFINPLFHTGPSTSPDIYMMTSSSGNILLTSPLWGESIGHRIPITKASGAELWCFLWSAPQQTVRQTVNTPVINKPSHPLMMSL